MTVLVVYAIPIASETPRRVNPVANVTDLGQLAAFLGNGLISSDQGDFGLDRSDFIAAPEVPGGLALRVHYPAGTASPHAAGGDPARAGGLQAYLRFPGPADTAYLQYQVRFQPGFDFVKGGKLPGLFGGSGGSGGDHRDDGFSTRYMWRKGGAGELYAYLPGGSGFGTSLGRGTWTFPAGQWTTIQQGVKLNTPGQRDGVVTVWVNGQQVFSQNDVQLRNTDQLHIDGLFFSTFFGGGDQSWASPSDQYADFANFGVSDRYIPPPDAVSQPAQSAQSR
ncbi:polysaccharide lyase [Pseudonocardia acaciae]|uniref:polysaccharide lyase n=1 Tax=Pseudonocardia acaciae TaxID=551276 RepID=UPI001B8080F4